MVRERKLNVSVEESLGYLFKPKEAKVYVIRPLVSGSEESELWKTIAEGEREILRYMRENNPGMRSLGKYGLMVGINNVNDVYKEDEEIVVSGVKNSLFWWVNELEMDFISFVLNGTWERTKQQSHHEKKILQYEEDALERYCEDLKIMPEDEAFEKWFSDSYI